MKPSSRSRLAPSAFPRMPPIAGVRLTTRSVGIKYARRHDLLLAECVRGSTVAGVFTRSTTAAAPVVWCREQLSRGRIRGLVVNSGNANAFTGLAGEEAVRATAAAAAQALGCLSNQVFVASTGVIGEPLPLNRLTGQCRGWGRPWRQAGGVQPPVQFALPTLSLRARGGAVRSVATRSHSAVLPKVLA